MRLALLGVDAETLELVRQIVAAGNHSITAYCLDAADAPLAEELSHLVPVADSLAHWDALLTYESADAVLVTLDEDAARREEQLRQFARAGLPLLVAHPACDLMMHYELEMVAGESGGVIVPCLAARSHPLVAKLNQLLVGGGPGSVEQIVMKRSLVSGSRDDAIRQFAIDIDLLGAVIGDVVRVSATDADEGAAQSLLSVQMANTEGVLIRWEVVPSHRENVTSLQVNGSGGAYELQMPTDAAWSLSVGSDANESSGETFEEEASAAALAIDELQYALEASDKLSRWRRATRSMEIVEGLRKSLLKRRTIDVAPRLASEMGAFKSTMTSIGCSLLMLSVVFFVAVGTLHWIAVNAGWTRMATVIGYWPWAMLAVFALFLLLQTLKLVIPSNQGR